MKNILVTGYDGSANNVMVYSEHVDDSMLRIFFDIQNESYTDIISLQDSECQHYIYEPLWMDREQEGNVIRVVTEAILNEDPFKERTINFNIISPDGFTIHFEDYTAEKTDFLDTIKKVFEEWKGNFARQGYYSSNEGRIELKDLYWYCKFVQLDPDPNLKSLPIHNKNLIFLIKSYHEE